MGKQDNASRPASATNEPAPQSPAVKPANTPPSATEPEDLHIPEKLPPPMPEEADKPEQPTGSDAVSGTHTPAEAAQGGSGQSTPQAADASPSETEPEDLHIPEKEPPPMPELADKPDEPQQKK